MTTTIAIKNSTRDALKGFGIKGQTYDEILIRLMEIAQYHSFLQDQKRIIRNEKFFPVDKI